MKYQVGPFNLSKYYYDEMQQSKYRNIVFTDEYLDQLGNQFQNTRLKHERGWTFDEWCSEMVGLLFWKSPKTGGKING